MSRIEDAYRATFGKQPSSVSWYLNKHFGDIIQFHAAPLYVHPRPPWLSISHVTLKIVDRDMPALYMMGVRDYDESIGILVLGNACGELAVLDITGHYSDALTSCLRSIPSLCAEESELMPTVSPFSIASLNKL